MRLQERLERDVKRAAKKRRQMEEEETMTYRKRQPGQFLNEEARRFQDGEENAFNRRQSVFDRMAVFHTDKEP